MIFHKSILILEDDFRTLSKILEKLAAFEDDQPYDFSLVILTTYEQVEMYINKAKKTKVDIILLDRDCKLGGVVQCIRSREDWAREGDCYILRA